MTQLFSKALESPNEETHDQLQACIDRGDFGGNNSASGQTTTHNEIPVNQTELSGGNIIDTEDENNNAPNPLTTTSDPQTESPDEQTGAETDNTAGAARFRTASSAFSRESTVERI